MNPEDRKRIETLIDHLREYNDYAEGRVTAMKEGIAKEEERVGMNCEAIITLCGLLA